jgi:hypothetical protein
MSLHLKSLLEDKWLLSATYDSAGYAWKTGRISDEQWTAYQFIWTWGAPRFGGRSAILQDRHFERFGDSSLNRRYVRVFKWVEAAKKLAFKS